MPIKPYEIRYATKLLLAQNGFLSVATWISFFGVFLGVLALILAMSVMNGFRDQTFMRLTQDGEHITVHEPPLRPYDYAQKTIIDGDVLLLSNYASIGGVARGTMEESLLQEPWAIELPFDMAEKLGLNAGDKVTLLSPKGVDTPFGWMPRKRDFLIERLSFTKSYAEMSYGDAQKFFDREQPNKTTLTLKDPMHSTTVKEQLKNTLQSTRITTWQEKNHALVNALKVERVVTTLILSFIIVVAVFNIVVSYVMKAKQKQKTIAVMRAMGMTKSAVSRIFIYSGMIVGGGGALLGGVLGLIITRYYDFLIRPLFDTRGMGLSGFFARLPFHPSHEFTVIVIASAIFLASLATLYPARKASHIQPTEAF